MIFILMSWNSRSKMKILIKLRFWTILPFHINRMPYLDSSKSSKIFYTSISFKTLVLPGQQQTWLIWQNVLIFCWYVWKSKLVNVPVLFHYWKILLIRMKKQISECTSIILLSKKALGKHFKVLRKFAVIASKFISLFSLYYLTTSQ